MRRAFVATIAAIALMRVSSAAACVVPPAGLFDSDLEDVPDGLVAARAEITAINWHGPHRGLPHSGVTLELRVRKAVAGISGETLSVYYGACSWLPGRVSDTVPVIARRSNDGALVAVDRNSLNYLRSGVR